MHYETSLDQKQTKSTSLIKRDRILDSPKKIPVLSFHTVNMLALTFKIQTIFEKISWSVFIIHFRADSKLTSISALYSNITENMVFRAIKKHTLVHMSICDPSCEKGPHGNAKSIDPGQSAQADHGRNFSLLADFLCINKPQTL